MKFLITLSASILQMGLIFLCNSVYTQNLSQIDVLTTADGLSFRDVANSVQDKNGLMWFGTNQGLNRYNGNDFKTYSNDPKNPFFIEEDFIKSNSLYDDLSNSVWFLANDNLFQLQLSTDLVLSYNDTHNLKGQVLDILQAPDASIWVVTDDFWQVEKGNARQYLQKYVDGNFKVMATADRFKRGFNMLTSDAKGCLWWTTTSGTYKYSLKGNLLETHQMDSYDWNGDMIHYVPQFFDSMNVHYYFPPSRGGVEVYSGQINRVQRVLNVGHIIRRAIEDQEKSIWFAGDDALYRMDAQGNFSDYTPLLKSKLDYTLINNLYIDQNKLLWVATNNGLFKIRTEKEVFSTVFKSEKEGWGNSMRGIFEAADGRIFSLCESKHQLWFKSKSGHLDSLALKTTSGKPLSLGYDTGFFVTNSSKTKAYAIGSGISEIDLNTGVTKRFDQFSETNKIYGLNALLRLKDGRLVFGYTLKLLTVFDPETGENHRILKDISTASNIMDLQFFEESRDDNSVWIGTKNDGILKIDLKGNILKRYNALTLPELGKHHILSLKEDFDGSLWIGTYGGGLSHLSADGKTFKNYKKANGLPDDNVVGILQDGNSKLWISTYNGLAMFDKTTKKFQNFYTEDGLSHNEFNYASSFKDSGGNFYFGGMNGLNRFKPIEVLKRTEAPKLQLVAVSGYNSKDKMQFSMDYSQTNFNALQVSPYDQYFEITWTMPSYFQNHKNTYSTKLEGLEEYWSYQGAKTSIRYNQLPAGAYVLQIKGKDSKGNENASILSIPIQVRQIFYKKWWFTGLVLFLIISIMYGFFKYRFQQALAMERFRTRIASDLHDDVGSLLSGLAMQTELMEINASDADKFKLQKIASISRNAVSQMRDLVWSIDSRRETIRDLIERMHELAEELLLPKDISFHIDSSNIKKPNRKLLASTKQHVFLIYKEAITNVLRHSDATSVEIIITNTSKGCDVVIRDNGSAKTSYKSTGLGLSNMMLRAEKLKGALIFRRKNGFGVHLHLPFNM